MTPLRALDPMLYAIDAVKAECDRSATPERLIDLMTGCVEDAWRDAMWQRALDTLPCVPATREAVDQLPRHGPCVYRIFGTDDREPDAGTILLYVGGTVEPRSRLKQHLLSGRFPGAQIIALESVAWSTGIAVIEERAIRWESPLHNSDGHSGALYRRHGGW